MLSIDKRPLPPTPPHATELKGKAVAVGPKKQSRGAQSKSHTDGQKTPQSGIAKVEKQESSAVAVVKDSASDQSGAQCNLVARAKRRERSQQRQSPTAIPKVGDKSVVKSETEERASALDVEDRLEQTFFMHDCVDASAGPDVNADEQMLCTMINTCVSAESDDTSQDHDRHSVFVSDDENDDDDDGIASAELSLTGDV